MFQCGVGIQVNEGEAKALAQNGPSITSGLITYEIYLMPNAVISNIFICNNVMKTIATKTSFVLNFAQIAWVVKDIKAAENFFKNIMGISNFSKTSISRAQDYEATYYGKPSNAETLVSMGYSGGTFIELIQPVSGDSMFQDYLDKNPEGGIQHIAYSIPVTEFDKAISELAAKDYPVIATYNTSIAKIVFFDTTKEIGVMTELMGITKEGEEQVQKMKVQMS